MKILFSVATFLFLSNVSYSQSNEIVGSWIWQDSVHAIHFFIKANGTVEKRTGLINENICSKTPLTGTYTFKNKHDLIITWGSKKKEIITIKFVDKNAEFQFSNQKAGSQKPYLFFRIVDEQAISDN